MAEGGSSEPNAEDEHIITLTEAIEMEQHLNDDVYAVLGACNDKTCSYSEGYVKRQALYSCLTCLPKSDDPAKRAGICLGCSYHCHDGHDLVELFTKRSFRCDCGNTKFCDKQCNLCPIKDDTNEKNVYNQNFSGVYCTCKRPYPDPEDTIESEMIQCIICEDWYHTHHLDAKVPENYAEMMCGDCVKKHNFILNYERFTITVVTPEADATTNVDVVNNEAATIEAGKSVNASNETESNGSTQSQAIVCTKPVLSPDSIECAKFFENESWREKLCKCENCMKMYENEKVTFLTDLLDTVHAYEVKGNAKALEQEKELQQKALKELPRVPLLETLAAYSDLKKNLGTYLQEFAKNKKVVRVEDIKRFFSDMEARKKPKLDYQYYCG